MAPDAQNTLPVNPLSSFPFARDWIEENGPAARFFLPADDGFVSAMRARDAWQWQPWNPTEVAELAAFNDSVGNSAGARFAGAFADPQTLAIVTGQQPNLFASPLFILHKALSARAHATRLEASSGRTVIPVFWVASDDHDFRELRDCWLLQEDGALSNLGDVCSRGDVPADSPSYLWNLSQSAPRLRQRVEEALPGACSKRAAQTLLSQALQGSCRFEETFCRTLVELLGPDQPVIFVVPRLRVLRNRQRALLRASFEAGDESARLLEQAAVEIAASGYSPQLHRDPDVLNAFYLHDQRRLRLVSEGGRVLVQDSLRHTIIKSMSWEQLCGELDQYPERFSPNVVTRPILQDIVLPTAAYIGGPGEVGYLAQLAGVYRLHEVPRPAVALRSLVTILDPCTIETLQQLGIDPEQPISGAVAVQEHILSTDPQTGSLLNAIRKLEADTAANLSAMRQDPALSHPHVAVAVEKTARSISQSLNRMRGRLARQVTRESWNRYARAMSALAPLAGPQERWLSPMNFLIKEDPAALAELLAKRCDYTSPYPQIARLD
ncbi:MAG: bacillithiol biosynthesis cysteine-adding enzyme BshC [Candidatus Sumerlaeaceae bacterium]